jgi:hypothetical protein
MNQTQIDYLREFAIDNLPRAQADRAQVNRYGGTHADLNIKLAGTATMVRGKAGTTAIEFAAANVLETVAILQAEREPPLSKPDRVKLHERLTTDAKELCILTDKSLSWLDAMPSTPEPEDEPPAPAIQIPLPSIAGRWLSTEEAAEVMGFAVQTLRMWSSTETGPIRPTKINRRLKWSGDEILALLSRKKK